MTLEWKFLTYCVLAFAAYVALIFAIDRVTKQKKRRKK